MIKETSFNPVVYQRPLELLFYSPKLKKRERNNDRKDAVEERRWVFSVILFFISALSRHSLWSEC